MTPEETTAIIAAVKPYADAMLLGPISEVGGILTDAVGQWRLRNQARLFKKTWAYLVELGIQPQKLLPDIFVPLVEGASNTEDETLSDMFARLLATHLDPARQGEVHPSFTKIMGQLSALDARLLRMIDDREKRAWELFVEEDKKPRDSILARYAEEKWGIIDLMKEVVGKHGAVPAGRIVLSLQNLERIGLTVTPKPAPFQWKEVAVSEFAEQFLAASMPADYWRHAAERDREERRRKYEAQQAENQVAGGPPV